MNVEIRIYKRYDTDLLSLHDAGYSVTKMMTEAVFAYANGLPFHLYIDELIPFDMNDKKSVRLRLKFKDSDRNVAALIRNVKHGYRSNFCKQVLRNALVCQNLFCYYTNASMLPLQEANIRTLNLHAFPGLKNCSDYRRMTQQLNILGRDITIQHTQGYKIPQRRSNANYDYSQGHMPYPNHSAQMMQPNMIQVPNYPLQSSAYVQQNDAEVQQNNQPVQNGSFYVQNAPINRKVNGVPSGTHPTSPEQVDAPFPAEPQITGQTPLPVQSEPSVSATSSAYEYELPPAGNTNKNEPDTPASGDKAALMRIFDGI